MSATDLVLQMIALLERLAIPYMLVGSYSSNYYGRPRSTNDADFVLVLSDEAMAALRRDLGAGWHFDPQMTFESITMTVRYVITHVASAFKLELFLLTDDPFDRSRFARRRQVEFEGRRVWLPAMEDVVVQKLRWAGSANRAKDLADVTEILRLRRSELDEAYIRRWTDQHGTTPVFEQLLLAVEQG